MVQQQRLGLRLRQARLEAGFSGAQLARLIGRSQPYISDLERGQRTPSLLTLQSIAAALGKSTSFFLDQAAEETASTRSEDANEIGSPGVFIVATGYVQNPDAARRLSQLMAEEGVKSFIFRARWELDRDRMSELVHDFLEQTLDRLDHEPRPRFRYEDFEDIPRRRRRSLEDFE